MNSQKSSEADSTEKRRQSSRPRKGPQCDAMVGSESGPPKDANYRADCGNNARSRESMRRWNERYRDMICREQIDAGREAGWRFRSQHGGLSWRRHLAGTCSPWITRGQGWQGAVLRKRGVQAATGTAQADWINETSNFCVQVNRVGTPVIRRRYLACVSKIFFSSSFGALHYPCSSCPAGVSRTTTWSRLHSG